MGWGRPWEEQNRADADAEQMQEDADEVVRRRGKGLGGWLGWLGWAGSVAGAGAGGTQYRC